MGVMSLEPWRNTHILSISYSFSPPSPIPHSLARLWPLWKQVYFLADFPTCVQQCIKCMFDKCLLKIIKLATLSLGVYALCQVFPVILFSPHSKPVRCKLYPPHVYRSGNRALYGLAACRSSYFSRYYYSIVSKPRGLKLYILQVTFSLRNNGNL